ncbi:MAG: thiol:disulfide interchange protein DsbC [Alteromonadaceae bacterium]|jgi:thiol:disulfide interchange protein DsbC
MKKYSRGLLPALLLLGGISGATATEKTDEVLNPTAKKAAQDKAVEAAQTKLQATFKKLRFSSFKPGPVEGLFEINAGGSIVYFHPGKTLLLMGEFYDKTGKNLTSTALEEDVAALQTDLPLDLALNIGSNEAKQSVIEFTSPNCGYCKAFDRFANDANKVKPLRRQVFFDVAYSADAQQKAMHILCSPDQAAAMQSIYQGINPEHYLNCEEGKQTLLAHAKAAQSAGIRGTPSFIIDGQLILGFAPAVKNYLQL